MVENLAHKGWVFNVDDPSADVNCAHDFFESCENCADDGNYVEGKPSNEELQKIDRRIHNLEYLIEQFDWGHAESGTPEEWAKLDSFEEELAKLYEMKDKLGKPKEMSLWKRELAGLPESQRPRNPKAFKRLRERFEADDTNWHPNVDRDMWQHPEIDSQEIWFADDEWEDEVSVDDYDW
jgi:hypothetical protein